MIQPRRSAVMRGLLAVSGLAVVLGCSSEKEPSERIGKTSQALSTGLVISQIYGGGGNTGAVYLNDYIEIFNRGPSTINLGGLSLQYAGATGAFSAGNTYALNAVDVPGGGYYLLKLASGGSVGVALPGFDQAGTTNMSASAGKVALVNGTTALTCDADGGTGSCFGAASVIDLVGYGPTANDSETSPTPVASATTAAVRKTGGCTETDNNLLDFEIVAVPTPRTSGSPLAPCSASDAGTDSGDTGDGGVSDTGTPDTGVLDTGPLDTGLIDTGPDDTGLIDTGVLDTGPDDTGTPDTGVIDTGPDDTGLIDTGVIDTGPDDTGLVDTGVVDTGVVDTGAADVGGTDTAIDDTATGDGTVADTGPADTAVDDTMAADSAIADALDSAVTDAADGGVDAVDSATTTSDTGSDAASSDTATGADTTASGDTAPATDTSSTSDAPSDSSSAGDSSSGTDTGGSDAGADDSGFAVEGSGCKCEMPGNQPRREVDFLALGAGLAGILLMRRRRR